jgi:threonyl-tRNA synthetase
MIHRALLGSLERFMGIYIEHTAGEFPVWLAPVQTKILPVTERNIKYAKSVAEKLKQESIRVEVDERNETLPAKIRDAQLEKVPYMLIVGDKEEKSKKVAVRLRTEKDLGQMGLGKFIVKVKNKIETKALDLV